MPKASDGEEGRGKRRNAVGTRWQGLIRRCPNGATHYLEEIVPFGGRTRRTETSKYPQEQKTTCDSLSSGERTGRSPNPLGYGLAGVVGPDTNLTTELK